MKDILKLFLFLDKFIRPMRTDNEWNIYFARKKMLERSSK